MPLPRINAAADGNQRRAAFSFCRAALSRPLRLPAVVAVASMTLACGAARAAPLTLGEAAALAHRGDDRLAAEATRDPSAVPAGIVRQLAPKGVRERDGALVTAAVAVMRARGDRRGEADLLVELGLYRYFVGENAGALAAYGEAERLYAALGDEVGVATARVREADVRMRTSDLAAVEGLLREASPVFARHGCKGGEGDVRRLVAHVAFSRGDTARACAEGEASLASYRAAGDEAGMAQICRILGDCYVRSGDIGKAARMYEESYRHALPTGEPFYIGRALWGRGAVAYRTGSYERALVAFEEARQLFSRARYPIGLGDVLQREGDIYRMAGDRERAIAAYRGALESYRSASSRVGMANATMRLGTMLLAHREWEEGFAAYDRAYLLYGEADWRLGCAEVELLRGIALEDRAATTAATAHLERALALFRAVGNPLGVADARMHLGELAAGSGDTARARELYGEALADYERMADIESESGLLFRQARLARREGRGAEARRLYERSIGLSERLRRGSGVDELKRSFMERVYDRYEEAALFMLDSGFTREGFTLAEGMKARLFLDRLTEAMADVEKGIDPAVKARRDRLEAHRDSLVEALRRAVTLGNDEAAGKLRREMAKVDDELERLRLTVRRDNPLYAAVQYPEPVTVATLQKEVLRSDEALLEYFIGAGKPWCFLVTPHDFRAEPLPVDGRALGRELRALAAALGNGEAAPVVTADEKRRLSRLYDLLIGPFRREVAGKKLIVVPDGPLALFPLEMLWDKRAHAFAVVTHDIRYIQSASVLAAQRRTPRPPAAGEGFIGVGDPVYDYEHFRHGRPELGAPVLLDAPPSSRGALPHGRILARLVGSGREVEDIAALFRKRGRPATLLLRLDAREEALKSPAMANYAYIHIAAHGILDGRFQALALSQVPNSREDGFLSLGEIMNSRYDARMVILSACRTGLGRLERGEGVTGLTRAVMYAGTPAAVVSLWSVGDAQTRRLMRYFYRALVVEGKQPAEALRAAKLRMLADDDEAYAHPFAWAAFVLYGE